MDPSPAALPQLSSYLPAPSSDTRTATTAITTTSCGAAKKRRNSIEGAYSAVSPRPPTPHQPEDDQRKRKQSPSAVIVKTKDSAPFSRLDSIYQGQGLGALQVSESVSLSSTWPAIHDGDSTSAADVHTTRYFASQSTTPRRERTSRYLSESDRREIITRIDGGEKQVTLAREFSVSRAAICNLYKNRWEVLTREGRNPESKHPKKARGKRSSPRLPSQSAANAEQIMVPEPTTSYPDVSTISINEDESPRGDQENYTKDREVEHRKDEGESNPISKGSPAEASARGDFPASQELGHQREHSQEQQDVAPRSQLHHYDVTGSSPVASKSFLVHEASAHSYPCRNLVAALRDETSSTVVFQQRATRLVRLLIEEALICLPHEDVEIKNQFGDVCHASKTLDERDICGVSMEDKGMVLLRAFSTISPTSPTGVVSLALTATSDAVKSEHAATSPTIHAQLPPVGPQQAVLLLDVQCATGNEACAVLHYLVHERCITASSIYFVTVISSFEGLQNVFRHFPGELQVFAARLLLH
jgi:uracil phosphoribosyltransferase